MRSAQSKLLKELEESNCELVVVMKGYYLKGATVEQIKSQGKTVVCFHPDDPFHPDFGSSNPDLRDAIKNYDAYFIWSHNLVKKIKEVSNTNVFYMPFAVDEDIIDPLDVTVRDEIEQDIDLCFIGQPDAKRIALIRSIAQLLPEDISVSVYGSRWPIIEGVKTRPAIYGDEFMNTMYRSKINLNILRDQNEGSNNMRTFEIPGARCFMLHEFSEEAAGFFEEGVQAEFYKTAEECAEKVIRYVRDRSLRLKIADAGYKHIYDAGYLYTNLMQNMLNTQGLGPAQSD